MIVILNRDVKGTGKAGDVVKVSDGSKEICCCLRVCKESHGGKHKKVSKNKRL